MKRVTRGSVPRRPFHFTLLAHPRAMPGERGIYDVDASSSYECWASRRSRCSCVETGQTLMSAETEPVGRSDY